MVQILGYAADALWIAALAMMATTARQAWGRVAAGTKVPVAIGPDGRPAMTAAKGPALLAVLVLAIVVGIALSLARLWADHNPLAALALFLVRTTLAAVLALAHLRWLRTLLERLGA